MKDIETRENLETFLTKFYKVATVGGEVGHHLESEL